MGDLVVLTFCGICVPVWLAPGGPLRVFFLGPCSYTCKVLQPPVLSALHFQANAAGQPSCCLCNHRSGLLCSSWVGAVGQRAVPILWSPPRPLWRFFFDCALLSCWVHPLAGACHLFQARLHSRLLQWWP